MTKTVKSTEAKKVTVITDAPAEAPIVNEAVAVAEEKATEVLKYDPAKLVGQPTSACIRYLDSCNLTRAQIANILQIRYQHVRNTLITPVAKPKTVIA